MDKDTEQHLKEYKKELSHLENRIQIMQGLIADILQAEDADDIKPAEHDFPNYAKYNKGTDI